ncbi:MAG: hypothetical protein LLF89_02655 [Spirochaetaceae bacterium]|nr:hypothetical protein [Spirochaetaceae bacterium]
MGKIAEASAGGYQWSFVRIGGVDQVVIRNGDDISHIPRLDQKLWAALAMPKKGDGLLPETLELLDADEDGRIRAPDICAAIDFASGNLASLDDFLSPGETLKLTNLKTEAGKEAAAKTLLMANGGKAPKAQEVSLTDSTLALEKFAEEKFNGDGVLAPASAGSEGLAAAIKDIVDAGYSRLDLNGEAGLDKVGYEAFLVEGEAWLDWSAKGVDPAVKPLGEATEAAWQALQAVREKINDWFLRSQLAALAGAKGDALGQDERLATLFASRIELTSPELLALPIAAPKATMVLDLSGALNPGWSQALGDFARLVAPLLGAKKTELSLADWENVKAGLGPYGAWLAAKPAGNAGSLGAERLVAIFGLKELGTIPALIEEDAAKAVLRDHMLELRKLILLRRDLMRILKNFVNFSDFYNQRNGIFQAGRLYLDARECKLCIEVDNPAAHATLASMSNVYLAYCDCSRKDGSRKSIVAGFTAGDANNLFVGRNGVFYDRDGLDWDACITKIVAQPISIREAFFSPYRWLSKTIGDMVQKRASSAESGVQGKLAGQAGAAVSAAAGEKKVEPPAVKKIDVGTVAAIGVALGSIGTMVTTIIGAFVGMGAWIPVGIVVILLLISGPSMIQAYLKLRKRNLGPILDAEGWAINGRLKINVPFGGSLTHLAVLPPGSERQLKDPFGEKKRPWGLYLAIVIVILLALLWVFGAVDPLLPPAAQFGTIIGR